MNEANQPSKIAFVSDYLPRRCGIATFTSDLRDAVVAQYPEAECGVLAVNDVSEGYDYAPEVRFEIGEQHLRDYQEAVNFLRFNGFDMVCRMRMSSGSTAAGRGATSWPSCARSISLW